MDKDTDNQMNQGGQDAGSRRPRLGIIGSGAGSNFAALAEAIGRGEMEAEIVVVVSDVEGAGILTKARALGLPAHFVDPGPWVNKMDDGAQVRLAELLTGAGVDLVVCAGFMRRLKGPVLEAFPRRILNIHPSLLPEFPGRDAIPRALEAGVKVSGCTVHLVNEEIDAGDILAQAQVAVEEGETVASLTGKINRAEHGLYPGAILGYWRKGERL